MLETQVNGQCFQKAFEREKPWTRNTKAGFINVITMNTVALFVFVFSSFESQGEFIFLNIAKTSHTHNTKHRHLKHLNTGTQKRVFLHNSGSKNFTKYCEDPQKRRSNALFVEILLLLLGWTWWQVLKVILLKCKTEWLFKGHECAHKWTVQAGKAVQAKKWHLCSLPIYNFGTSSFFFFFFCFFSFPFSNTGSYMRNGEVVQISATSSSVQREIVKWTRCLQFLKCFIRKGNSLVK